jgi:hypothetical protein
MRNNLGPRDLQNVPLKLGWREYSFSFVLLVFDLSKSKTRKLNPSLMLSYPVRIV